MLHDPFPNFPSQVTIKVLVTSSCPKGFPIYLGTSISFFMRMMLLSKVEKLDATFFVTTVFQLWSGYSCKYFAYFSLRLAIRTGTNPMGSNTARLKPSSSLFLMSLELSQSSTSSSLSRASKKLRSPLAFRPRLSGHFLIPRVSRSRLKLRPRCDASCREYFSTLFTVMALSGLAISSLT